MPKENNWWGPAGKTGPCGPDTEMFYWKSKNSPPKKFNPDDKNWVEIWNDVLMQYVKDEKENYVEAKQKNIDTGMGVERTIAVLNNLEDNYLTDAFLPIIKKIEEVSNKKYGKDKEETRSMRIIADHLKASVFILAENISPSNKEQGYVLRRLIRRSVRHGTLLGIENNFTKEIAKSIILTYQDYDHLNKNKEFILLEIEKEENRFKQTLNQGLKYFEKITKGKKEITGGEAFLLYQSYGFPLEMIQELGKEKKFKIDVPGFNREFEKHQELSRTATEGKFKSGLADNSEATKKLHTATHLLNEALRISLNKPDLIQKGSNITPERLRFDFNFDRKLTKEEIKKVEDLVNKKIRESLEVKREEMTVDKAKKLGAQGVFEHKYGEKISVYIVGNFSKEICTGPHVKNTKEIGKFKIIKEEAVAAGIRRIKAILE